MIEEAATVVAAAKAIIVTVAGPVVAANVDIRNTFS
jgi:hypothetical protein